jgi:L-ascorbate metabolism protein UlaG (beta-lactamase superfamily)
VRRLHLWHPQSLGRLAAAALAALALLAAAPATPAVPAAPAAPAARQPVKLTYLGNAGWQIEDGRTVILVDPYLSQFSDPRASAASSFDDTDDVEVPATAQIDAHVRRADFILITHGHPDHMLDAPYIAKKTGATIIGHETAANLARASDVPEAQLIIVRGGEDYEFGAFSLRVIPSLHSPLLAKHYYNRPWAGTAPRGLRAPLHASSYVEGGTLAYLLRLGGHAILVTGTMNFIEREMEGLRPDIALVGAGGSRHESFDYAGRLMRALGLPAVVLPTHWDSWISATAEKAHQNALEFAAEITAASPATRVIVPAYFEPITLP